MRVLAECGLEDELTTFLGFPKNSQNFAKKAGNGRNGHTKKTLKSSVGNITIDIPHDCKGEFSPSLIPKYSRMFPEDLSTVILSLYSKGMTTRDISDHLAKIYGCDVSAETISRITDEIMPQIRERQSRPLDPVYPVLFLDGIVLSVHNDTGIVNKTAYVAFAFTLDGFKEILGFWMGEAESSKFWMNVLSDLKARGVVDIPIACIDGLSGFEDAIHAVFPKTIIQSCIVHQIRNSVKFASYEQRKKMCKELKPIYTAPNKELGYAALMEFSDKWGESFPYVVKKWIENWDVLSSFYQFPVEMRPLIYTTNIIENFNSKIRAVTRKRKIFPNNDAVLKCLYLTAIDMQDKQKQQIRNWNLIMKGLIIEFGERIEQYL